jgi:diguanylate cyclase (GGDEF)-like protein
MDLDRFKQVNDNAGHAAGDQVLIDLARLLQARVRGSDMVGRLGGDEFVVLLDRCELAAALAVAEQIRADVQNLRFEWDGVRYDVGVSVGVAALDASVTDLAAAFAKADAACYDAKRSGRNSVRSSDLVTSVAVREGRRLSAT